MAARKTFFHGSSVRKQILLLRKDSVTLREKSQLWALDAGLCLSPITCTYYWADVGHEKGQFKVALESLRATELDQSGSSCCVALPGRHLWIGAQKLHR